MKKNTVTIFFIIIAIFALYISKNIYGSYNLDKSTKACVLAQKKTTTKSIKEIKNFCDKELKKLKND
tara:strand:+ start:484 stop:684 length:201 start_codon:yes stop_codon:yes gene_type:complete